MYNGLIIFKSRLELIICLSNNMSIIKDAQLYHRNINCNQLNMCSSPIDKITDDKITNSSSSSIRTYIKMLSNNSHQKKNKPNYSKLDQNYKSNIQLKSIQLSFSRNKANNPSEGSNCFKTTPELLLNNPYISKVILNKMNEIIIENSSEVIEFKRKLFQKTIANQNEQCKIQSENNKNEIIKMLINDKDKMKRKSSINSIHMKSALPANKIMTINHSCNNLHQYQNRCSSVIKVAQMKNMLDRVFEVCCNYPNQPINNANSIKNNNAFSFSKPNGIKSRLLITYNSSKDVLRRKRIEEENDVDLFKMQLDQKKNDKQVINYSSLPNQLLYLRNQKGEKI